MIQYMSVYENTKEIILCDGGQDLFLTDSCVAVQGAVELGLQELMYSEVSSCHF